MYYNITLLLTDSTRIFIGFYPIVLTVYLFQLTYVKFMIQSNYKSKRFLDEKSGRKSNKIKIISYYRIKK